MRIGSLYYRAWAAKSKNEGYLFCKWCDSEILIKNVAGKHGHEQSTIHQTNREKYESHPDRKNDAVQKERQILPRVLENYQITKLFELRLLGFCAGNYTFQNRSKADYFYIKERNISLRTMGDIAKFLRNEAIEVPSLMRILSTQNLHRDKARFLLVDVLKTSYKNNLGKIIATTPFSISADEVTDLCGFRYLGTHPSWRGR